MRVLVCGDRNWHNYEFIYEILSNYKDEIDVVIEGEAKGADSMAGLAAELLGIPVLKFPADWDRYGRAAGPIRNTQMLNEGNPDLVIAFHNDVTQSKGTKNMIEQAKTRYITVKLYSEKGLLYEYKQAQLPIF